MHPEILRQMIDQRSRETQARAEENRLARQLLRSLRSQRRDGLAAGHDGYAIPAIPDYVDGSFVDSAAGEAKSGPARGEHRVPTARNAA
jgi:hypothetical protein